MVPHGRSLRGFVTMVLLVMAVRLAAQGLPDATIDGVVRRAAEIFAREYFDVPLSIRVRDELLQRLADGRYAGAASNQELAERLTRDLRELTRDKHVAVLRTVAGPTGSGGPRDVPTTFGFRRIQILPGNIGLLDLAFFLRPAEHRDALAAAMKTLQPADALILDLRANGGGSPDTAALLIGYLLDTPGLPLFEIRHRDGRTDRYATPSTRPAEGNGSRPVYVLTSSHTFSAGEGVPFLLRELRHVIVIGESTAGAANPGRPYPIDDVFEIAVSNGQVVTARGRTNWEGAGVTPDVPVPADNALNVAHVRAIDDLLAATPPGPKHDQLRRIRAELSASVKNLR
jgi:hypothetical protein